MRDKKKGGIENSPQECAPAGLPLVVCPACQYGFPDKDPEQETFTCPRSACGHRWEALTETVAAVHATRGRRARPELGVTAGASPVRLELFEGETLIGREPQCRFLLDNLSVSRLHSRVVRRGDDVWIEDLGSAYGTFVNGKRIEGKVSLTPCDELLVGGVTLQFAVYYAPVEGNRELVDNSLLIGRGARAAPQMGGEAAQVIPLTRRRLTFGRAQDRDVVLPDAMISRRQAILDYHDSGYFLSDVQSRFGTFVNGKSIIRARLEPGDRIQMGPYLFHFDGGQLRRLLHLTSLGIVAVGLGQKAGKIQLLDDISLVLRPGEFVGLLGPSGAGKTTLLDALNGLRPARAGQVHVNGDPLYEQYGRLRHHIGYVPQDDIIHGELTCRQALFFAGRLRLPADLTRKELRRLVEETLAAVDLSARGDVRISRLSGGQRKRASVAVELLSKPGILFLDEPTSGLDPAAESRLMRKFRQLADQGRTIVCTTHVMENVDLFDKVVVLAPGGRLAYFGPAVEAKSYFGIDKFTLLYDRLADMEPEAWKKEYRQSSLCRELLGPAVEPGKAPIPPRRGRLEPAPLSSLGGQWATLARRFGKVLGSDRQNLGLLAAQPVVIAALICLVCSDLPLIYFLLAISALWFGLSSAAQQIVKERAIYRRERMVNLRLDCYVLSKFLPLAGICAVQCGLMLGLVWLLRGGEGSGMIQFMTLALASWNGVALGLIVSAGAANADKATSVVPLTLIPQIILAGTLVPLPDMNWPTQALSYVTVSRWANQALEIGLLQGRKIEADLVSQPATAGPLRNLYADYDLEKEEGRRRFMQDYRDASVDRTGLLIVDVLVLLAMMAGQLIVVGWFLRRQDAL